MIVIMMVAAMAVSGPTTDLTDQINARCVDKWGEDYRMQKYCRKKQAKGMKAVGEFYKKHSLDKEENKRGTYGRISSKCMIKWSDKFGPDWSMVKYCIGKQVEAYRELQK